MYKDGCEPARNQYLEQCLVTQTNKQENIHEQGKQNMQGCNQHIEITQDGVKQVGQ